MPRAADSAPEPSGDEEEAEGLLGSSNLEDTAALPADLGHSGYDVVPKGEHTAKATDVTK